MRGLPGPLQPEVVIVSPLRRTLETAAGIFGSEEPWAEGAPPPLMTAIESVPNVGAAAASRCAPVNHAARPAPRQ